MTASDTADTLSVSVARLISYQINHVRDVFNKDEAALSNLLQSKPTMIVVDDKVDAIYGRDLKKYANLYLNCLSIIVLPASEIEKSWERVAYLCQEMISCNLPRDGIVLAVGGGVTLDATGVAAAMYRRGVRFVRIPTTLVGLVDVGVGIKQGVNFGGKKNILGAFYPPFGVLNDLTFLRTLPPRHLACGIAEIVKLALVCDAILFEETEQFGTSLLKTRFQSPYKQAEHIILRSERAMIRQLEPNLFEYDYHRLVDFGHTFSPLLEMQSSHDLSHGEAVAIDMLISTAIGERRNLCDSSLLDRVLRLLMGVQLPWSHEACKPAVLVKALEEARAHRGGDLNLVVPTGVGEAAFISHVDPHEIDEGLALVERRARATTSEIT
jgi:3-dehydroquinate synthase